MLKNQIKDDLPRKKQQPYWMDNIISEKGKMYLYYHTQQNNYNLEACNSKTKRVSEMWNGLFRKVIIGDLNEQGGCFTGKHSLYENSNDWSKIDYVCII